MTYQQDPRVTAYLEQFRNGLNAARPEDRAEFARELDSHIAEAVAAGEDPAAVLDRLGPPDRLAKAYRLELALSSGARSPAWRAFAVIGVVLTASIPSMIIIPLLFTLGIGFLVGGGAAIVMASIPAIDADFYNISNDALNRLLGALTGLGLMLSGAIALFALYLYVLLLVRAMRGALRV